MKMKWLSLLLAFTMLTAVLNIALAEGDDPAKVLTVNNAEGVEEVEGSVYNTVLGALNYIKEQGYPAGYTIQIETGTYDRFYVNSNFKELTITAAEGADVTINVIDGKTSAEDQKAIYGEVVTGSECGSQCVLIRGTDITLSGLTFKYHAPRSSWMDAAIALYKGSLVAENCVFDGTQTSDGNGIFVNNYTYELTVRGCEFKSLTEGVSIHLTGNWPTGFLFDNNKFINCSFATHGSYIAADVLTDKKVDPEKKAQYDTFENYFKFTNNTLIGTKDLRNKFVFQDCYDANMSTVTVTGNKLEYGLLGVSNISVAGGDLTADVLTNNTFGVYSFATDTIYDYANNTETVGVYMADPDAYGEWVLLPGNGLEGKDFYPLVQKAVAEANAKHSKVLQITGLEGYEDVIYTFTWYKDAIYWNDLPKPTPVPTPRPTPRPTAIPTATPTATPDMSDLPETGDNSHFEVFAALLFVSFAGMLLLLKKRSA